MDVYQKVLLKLYQVTGGKDSYTVDLKDLVKGQGFLGNYNEIFQMLNGQGWIAETPKANYVRITHWGVKEAKKSGNNLPKATQIVKRQLCLPAYAKTNCGQAPARRTGRLSACLCKDKLRASPSPQSPPECIAALVGTRRFSPLLSNWQASLRLSKTSNFRARLNFGYNRSSCGFDIWLSFSSQKNSTIYWFPQPTLCNNAIISC